MADDGMLLNFDLSNVAVPTAQVKFKGGRWRDRNRAQRDAKRQQQIAAGETVEEKDRPVKRRRTEDGGNGDERRREGTTLRNKSSSHNDDPWSRPAPSSLNGPAQRNPHGVTSRLFTANPMPTADFEAAVAAAAEEEGAGKETEPVAPSNAPLSEEAATFQALGLSRRVATHLSAKMGLKAPTAIQRNAVTQLVSRDSDAFLQAETGSGKTLAYLLPIVQRLVGLSEKGGASIDRKAGLFAIVLAPTRELCKQIAVVLERLLRCAPWLVGTTVTGGESKKAEKARIRKGVNILIATPGRLTDHLDNTAVLDVGAVRWLVLDEGDRLMEMGFEEDIRTIVGHIRKKPLVDVSSGRGNNKKLPVGEGMLPSRRVTVLCSATMKMNVQKLGEISLEDAVHVTAAGDGNSNNANESTADVATETAKTAFSAPAQLKQSYIVVPAKLRLVTLIGLLRATFARKGSVMKAIVFISCADSVDFHYDLLKADKEPETKDKSIEKKRKRKSKEDGESDSDSEGGAPIDSSDNEDEDEDEDNNDGDKGKPKKPTHQKTSNSTETTVAPASYLTSPANRTIMLHRLHGSLAQPVRTATLAAFSRDKNPAVLITTDIASRGLDVPAVDLVVEYDPAFAVADHLHRVGRTARAGRPGKAVLFLQPGCEEGYVKLLSGEEGEGGKITPQLYDSVLQKGLATPVEVPSPPPGEPAPDAQHDPSLPQLSWTKRAEALQLHLEHRMLPKMKTVVTSTAGRGGKKGKGKKNQKTSSTSENQNKLLDAARQAFRSHIRAYATHVRDERVYFDMMQLHLGHTAKSFGLREAPGGLGGGVQRRTKQKPGAVASGKSKTALSSSTSSGKARDDSDDESRGGVDEDAARRMREKMQAMARNAASEFNIG